MATVNAEKYEPTIRKVVIELEPNEARAVMDRLLLRGNVTTNVRAREIGRQIQRALGVSQGVADQESDVQGRIDREPEALEPVDEDEDRIGVTPDQRSYANQFIQEIADQFVTWFEHSKYGGLTVTRSEMQSTVRVKLREAYWAGWNRRGLSVLPDAPGLVALGIDRTAYYDLRISGEKLELLLVAIRRGGLGNIAGAHLESTLKSARKVDAG